MTALQDTQINPLKSSPYLSRRFCVAPMIDGWYTDWKPHSARHSNLWLI